MVMYSRLKKRHFLNGNGETFNDFCKPANEGTVVPTNIVLMLCVRMGYSSYIINISVFISYFL